MCISFTACVRYSCIRLHFFPVLISSSQFFPNSWLHPLCFVCVCVRKGISLILISFFCSVCSFSPFVPFLSLSSFQVMQTMLGAWDRDNTGGEHSPSHLVRHCATNNLAKSVMTFNTPYRYVLKYRHVLSPRVLERPPSKHWGWH